MKNFNQLSRAEMKNVLGGNLPVSGIMCKYSNSDGSSTDAYCTSGSLTSCQNAADADCAKDNGCDDVDCRYVA